MVFGSRISPADLAGPPHCLPRGFLCGSLAGLSGPPSRGPRGSDPRVYLFSNSSCRNRPRYSPDCHTRASLGPNAGSLVQRACFLGMPLPVLRQSRIPVKKYGLHCLARCELWNVLVVGFRFVVGSIPSVSMTGGAASLTHNARCDGSLRSGVLQVSRRSP